VAVTRQRDEQPGAAQSAPEVASAPVAGARPGPDLSEEAALWRKVYEGEVLGEAFFSRMAELASDSDQRRKLEALAAMERSTAVLVRPCLERRGLQASVDPAAVDGIRTIEALDWDAMLRGLPAITKDYMTSYERLAELVGGDDARVVALLIAHERALEEFARREIAGERDRSLAPIQDLPHVALPA
jgi:hypothetical protein